MVAGQADRVGIVDEGTIDVGHLDLGGVAREDPAVALGARHPAAGGGSYQDLFTAIGRQALRTREAVEREDVAALVRAGERAQHPERIGELLALHAMAL